MPSAEFIVGSLLSQRQTPHRGLAQHGQQWPVLQLPPETTTRAVPLPEVLSGRQKHNKNYQIISPFAEQWDLKIYVRQGITCRIGRGRGRGGMRTTFPINAFYFLVSERAVSHFNVNYSSLLSGQSVACKCTSQVKRGICLGVQTETNRSILIWGWEVVK